MTSYNIVRLSFVMLATSGNVFGVQHAQMGRDRGGGWTHCRGKKAWAQL